MEDRKEIEIIIETIEGILQKDIKETDENVYTIDGRQYKAIKNILAENENLKQAAIINDSLYKEVCNKNKELEEENENYEKGIQRLKDKIKKLENESIEETVNRATYRLKHYYIPKSLIKEKIEEYINSILENLDEDRRWCDMELVDNFRGLENEIMGLF